MDADKPDIALLEEIEAHAVSIARGAGNILLEHFNKPLDVKFKGKKSTDPVTIADGRAEEYLKAAIMAKFPEHGILGEEGAALGKPDSPFLWVLDPLDGTCNFMNGLPFFAVSVGVLWKGQPVVGAIYVPVSHRTTAGVYHACLGKGAWLDADRIEVLRTPTGRPLSAMPPQSGSGFRLSVKSRKEPHEARNTGSIAVELAYTACGVFQYAMFGGPKIWDVAAGVLLVKEAGGVAFIGRRDGRTWLPVEIFEAPQSKEAEPLKRLGKWSAPIIVGVPDIAGKVVKDMRIPHSPLSWLRALRRRAGQKNKK